MDYAHVHHVVYRDIRVECDGIHQRPGIQTSDDMVFQEDPESDYLPMLLNASVFAHPEYSAGSPKRGEKRSYCFSNYSCNRWQNAAIQFFRL